MYSCDTDVPRSARRTGRCTEAIVQHAVIREFPGKNTTSLGLQQLQAQIKVANLRQPGSKTQKRIFLMNRRYVARPLEMIGASRADILLLFDSRSVGDRSKNDRRSIFFNRRP